MDSSTSAASLMAQIGDLKVRSTLQDKLIDLGVVIAETMAFCEDESLSELDRQRAKEWLVLIVSNASESVRDWYVDK